MFVLLCSFIPQSVFASVQFSPTAWPQDTGAPVNSSPVLGDLDRDGILEIVVGSDNNKVYAWKPDGTLMPGWPVTTGDSVRSSPALADINGDGYLDVIVGSFDNKVYAWNFNGSLLPGWPAATGSVIYSSPAVGDIDGDQLPEIVVGSFDNKVYAWNADGTLVRGWPKPTGLFVYSSPALADIDQDGLVEVIIGTDNNRVFAWNGDGTDVEGWPTATEHVVPSSPAVGDVDNDGELEVVVGSWDKVFMWNSRGERKPGWPVRADHQIPSSPALADLTNDGNLETIIGCKDGKVYAWNAQGQLIQGWPTITDAEISGSPVVADLNGDGRLEVVIGSKDNRVYVWDAAGRLLPDWPKNTGGAISSTPAVGDTDQDGTLELVIGSKDHRVYAWNFPRSGALEPTIVWQNFRGNLPHTGKYGDFTPSVYFAKTQSGEPSIVAPQTLESQVVEPQILEAPASGQQIRIIHARPGVPMEKSGTRTLPSEASSTQQEFTEEDIPETPILQQVLAEGYVNDLTISDYDDSSITLTWTAPLGAYTPQAMYDIRFSPQPITEETWDLAQQYPEIIPLAEAGTREVHQLDNAYLPKLRTGELLYLAVKIVDKARGAFLPVSPISNVVGLEPLDNKPPAKIQTIAVKELNDTTLELSWKTTGDDGSQGIADKYDIRYAAVPLNELTWLRATPVDEIPAPLPAGMDQKIQVPKPWEDREIFWGIKVIDESLNISELSEVAVWSPPDTIPPSRIVDLQIRVEENTISLTWTAPGNNRNIGQAKTYDIRYAALPIAESSWDAAIPVTNPPIPQMAGTAQTYILENIPAGQKVFIGIKAIDEYDNYSVLSNLVEASIKDMTPPPVIADLQVEEIGRDWAKMTWTSQGDSAPGETAAAYVLRYGNNLEVVKSWKDAIDLEELPSPGPKGTKETATIAGLEENSTYYVGLRVRDDQGNSSEISNIVRIITPERPTPKTVTDLQIEEVGRDWASVSWTVPGDSFLDGVGVVYDLRYGDNIQVVKSWEDAVDVKELPSPRLVGTKETVIITGLEENSTYYVGLRILDDRGKSSETSNIVRITTLKRPAPKTVADLQVEEIGRDWATVTWTVPGDDVQGDLAVAYALKYSDNLQVVKSWEDAVDVKELPSPGAIGTKETVTIRGLEENSTYYVGLRVLDDRGESSETSNIVRITTLERPVPKTVTDLQVEEIGRDWATVTWTVPGESLLDNTGTAYDLRYGDNVQAVKSWKDAVNVKNLPSPGLVGMKETVRIKGLEENTTYYVGVRVLDDRGESSETSNIIRIITLERPVPKTVADLQVEEVGRDWATVVWTVPGDDAQGALAIAYVLKYSDNLQVITSWKDAIDVKALPSPGLIGMKETVTIKGLEENTTYYVGVRVLDDRGESSETSNIIRITTLERPVPKTVADLQAQEIGRDWATLTWTVPGDDAQGDLAIAYALKYSDNLQVVTSWKNAINVGELPLPGPTGTRETVTIKGLEEDTTYYVGLRVFDDRGKSSEISNILRVTTLRHPAPGLVTDLIIEELSADGVTINWTAPEQHLDDKIVGVKGYDLRYSLSEITEDKWESATKFRNIPTPSDPKMLEVFTIVDGPKDSPFYVALKSYDEVGKISGLSNVLAIPRIDTVPPDPAIDLFVEDVGQDWAKISWTATGDDQNIGQAKAQMIRIAPAFKQLKTWDQAKEVPNTLIPSPAGTRDSFTIPGLQSDSTYYIAIKSVDAFGNESEMSNMVRAKTKDAVAPAAIRDLQSIEIGANMVVLQWTASGENGMDGQAASYDVRYAGETITPANWQVMPVIPQVPVPEPAGTIQTMLVPGLQPNTKYYFSIVAIDASGNPSSLSNVLEATTQDTMAPAVITTLRAENIDRNSAFLSWLSPGDDELHDTPGNYEVRYSSIPLSEASWSQATLAQGSPHPSPQGEEERFLLSGLRPDSLYYIGVKTIDVSGNASQLSNIVRIHTSENAVTDLEIVGFTPQTVTLSWKTPGGVLSDGEERRYDIRYATTRISEESWWDEAVPVPNVDPYDLLMQEPGTSETITLAGLPFYEHLFFAIRVVPEFLEDEFDPRISALSNVVELQRDDSVAPAKITDLMVKDLGSAPNGMRLLEMSWIAPGDNQFDGTASKYELRYGMVPPNKSNWESLTPVYNVPEPFLAETVQRVQVQIPAGEDIVYFAIRTADEAYNFSDLSNIAQWAPEDVLPPAQITDLEVERLANGDISITWTAPGDNEHRGTAAFYDLRYATKEADVKSWEKAMLVPGEPLPEAAGTSQEYTLAGLRKDTTYYIAMTTTDDAKNTSGLSNIVVVVEVPPEEIRDLAFVKGSETEMTVTLSWTAPRDRVSDRVMSYEIRHSEDQLQLEQWNRAKKYKHKMVPQESGAIESITIEKLAPNRRYYFAIKSRDHSKELSNMSNIAVADTADTIPPKAITDLMIETTSEHSVTLNWTVVEDDEIREIPQFYEIRYSLDPITEMTWETASFATDQLLEPSSLGSQMEYTVSNLAENTRYHFAVRALDEAENISPLSNMVIARTLDITPPQAIVDLRAAFPTANSVMLSWTAPSDVPGSSSRSVSDTLITAGGLAVEETHISAYDIRYVKMSPNGGTLDDWAWEGAEKVLTPTTPLLPGTREEFVVRNLEPNQSYYFAIKSIDQSGNTSMISNVMIETTFPAELMLQSTRAIVPTEKLGWKLVQGKDFGELQQDRQGILSLQKTRDSRGMTTAAAMTALYPQNDADLGLRQGELTFQVKGASPFTVCTKVIAEDSGSPYYLCYIPQEPVATETTNARGLVPVPVMPKRKRIENYVFYPLDSALLDNRWYEVRRDLTRDLFEGTGHIYKHATRFSIRGDDVSFKNITVKGAVFTPIADFEDRFAPLENGWKLHFGNGTVELAQEPVSGNIGETGGQRRGTGEPVIAGVTPRGIQGVEELNSFLYARSVNESNLVLTYPKTGMVELSDKPFFLARVKAGPEFKLILKVRTTDQREYYLAYLPQSVFQANNSSSGNYIYRPLYATPLGDGWTLIRADIEKDLRDNQLKHASTIWLSFHGKELSIDDVGFSTEILETILE